MTDGSDLVAAIKEFEAALPGWWWTVGYCGISRDASCGPDYSNFNTDHLELELFDNGFHCDDKEPGSTVAGSLRNVMHQALEAKAELSSDPKAAIQRYITTLMKERGFSRKEASAHAAKMKARVEKMRRVFHPPSRHGEG